MIIEFINMIPLELDTIEELISPLDDTQPGDEVLGELSETLKKLYTFWKQTGRTAGALENDLNWGDRTEEKLARSYELSTKTAAINAIFWVAVYDELKLWGCRDPLAIRKGFKVVKVKAERSSFPGFFKFYGGPNG